VNGGGGVHGFWTRSQVGYTILCFIVFVINRFYGRKLIK
jgi:hypothetical protein